MMNWVDRTQPPVVILENVEGAPWQLIADRWTQHGYVASFMSMDAKHYYIPHTRKRKYLVAVCMYRAYNLLLSVGLVPLSCLGS